MKHLPFLLLFITFNASSQKAESNSFKFLRIEDFTIEKDYVIAINKEINLQDFNQNLVTVKFDFTANREGFDKSNLKQISIMISEANNKTLEKAENKATYIPEKVICSYVTEYKSWLIHILYSCTTKSGDKKSSFSISTFSADGTFISNSF